MLKYILLILISLIFPQISDYSYTGAEASAMVGAIVSEKGSNWSILHNPAGIAEVNSTHFSTGGGNLYNLNWLSNYYINGIFKIPALGKISFTLQQLKTRYNGKMLSNEQTISISQGFNLQKDNNSHLSVGFTSNFIKWNLSKSSGINGDGTNGIEPTNINTLTIDIGLLASLRHKYRFGLFMKNFNSGAIGNGMSRQILPKRINIGITYIPIKDLSTNLVYENTLGKKNLQFKASIKYNLEPKITIYIGTQSNPNRLGIGATYNFNKYFITYSILTHPVLPITQQFSFSTNI